MRLDDVVSLDEAAERFGRQPEAFRKAAQRGTLEAKRVTPRCWVTTYELAAAYVARVAVARPVRRPPGGIHSPTHDRWTAKDARAAVPDV